MIYTINLTKIKICPIQEQVAEESLMRKIAKKKIRMNKSWEKLSAYHWLSAMTANTSASSDKIITNLIENEMPDMCSVVFERQCNGKCLHCIYKPCKESSRNYSEKYQLEDCVINLVQQLKTTLRGLPPTLTHAGRILQKTHLPFLSKISNDFPDLEIELLDDGGFTKLIKETEECQLKFNSINISVDGTEKIHNLQRNSKSAFRTALDGIEKAHQILKKNGTLHIGITVTKINHANVKETIDFLLSKYPHITSISIVPISPERVGTGHLETNSKEFSTLLNDIKKIFRTHNKKKQVVFFQIFHLRDLEKLSDFIGKKRLLNAFKSKTTNSKSDGVIGMYPGKIKINLKNMFSFSYYPMSLAPTEAFLVDADAAIRQPLSQIHNLKELRTKNFSHFKVAQLDKKTSLPELHKKTVLKWFDEKNGEGKKYLEEETRFFQNKKSSN